MLVEQKSCFMVFLILLPLLLDYLFFRNKLLLFALFLTIILMRPAPDRLHQSHVILTVLIAAAMSTSSPASSLSGDHMHGS